MLETAPNQNRPLDQPNLVEHYGPIGIRAVVAACAVRSPEKPRSETEIDCGLRQAEFWRFFER